VCREIPAARFQQSPILSPRSKNRAAQNLFQSCQAKVTRFPTQAWRNAPTLGVKWGSAAGPNKEKSGRCAPVTIGTDLGSRLCGRAVFKMADRREWPAARMDSTCRRELPIIARPSVSRGAARPHQAEIDHLKSSYGSDLRVPRSQTGNRRLLLHFSRVWHSSPQSCKRYFSDHLLGSDTAGVQHS
jgi:hypothetical protein